MLSYLNHASLKKKNTAKSKAMNQSDDDEGAGSELAI